MESMDQKALREIIKSLCHTEVTKTVHDSVYPAIASTRPELSQAGRVVLITGGGTGVGFASARAFVRASASTVIILGRRADVLAKAVTKLEEEAKTSGTNTKILSRTCDMLDFAQVDAFWKEFADKGITVDVFVANAAKFTETKSILELGFDEVWSQVEANAKSPLYFAQKLYAQPGDRQRFIVNVTSAVIHMTSHPQVVQRPAYVSSKMAGAILFQMMALAVSPEKLQIVTYHPGTVYGEGWKVMGFPPEVFDSDELCGAYSVWAASKEAQFLHGRFVWASWDVEELAVEVRKQVDPEYLRASIVGANGASA